VDRLYKSSRVKGSGGSSTSPSKYPNTVKINNYFSSSLREAKPAQIHNSKTATVQQNSKPQWKASDSKKGTKQRSVSRSADKLPPKKATTAKSDKAEIDSIVERLSRVKIEKPVEKPPVAKPEPVAPKKSVSPPKERRPPVVPPTPKPEPPKVEKPVVKPTPKVVEKPKSPPVAKKPEVAPKKEPEPVIEKSTSYIELASVESVKEEERKTEAIPRPKTPEVELEEPVPAETIEEPVEEPVEEVVTKPTRVGPQGTDDPPTIHLIKPSESRPASIPVVCGALHSNKNEFQEVFPLSIFITPVGGLLPRWRRCPRRCSTSCHRCSCTWSLSREISWID
jgi:hypothetical protein